MELLPLIPLVPVSAIILLAVWGFLRRHDPVRVRVRVRVRGERGANRWARR